MAGMVGTRQPIGRCLLGLGTVLLAVVACGPAMVWRRSGTTDADRRRDEAECAARADLEKSTPAIVQRAGPGSRMLSESIELETRRRFDVDLYRACLESRGYRRVPVTREEG